MRVILIAIGMYAKPCSVSLAFIACKATPIGIPVSGPVQTDKDMRAGSFHYYAIIIYTPIAFTNNL